jgi:HD-GYP domain-containing protein (c-di-GMP phosphodiesterase class II)
LAVFFLLREEEERKIETAFCVEAADRTAAIKNTFKSHVSLLESVQATFNSVPQLHREEFDKLLQPFRDHAHSIVAVEWMPCVPHNQRYQYEEAARHDGIEGFQFTELDSRQQIVRAAVRSEYFPIYYIGPGSGNPLVFGYDLASEPTRFETVRKARDSGKIQASGRITFLQDQTVKNGFLILLPVYEPGKPLESLEDRRRNFRGAVVGVFQPDVLIESTIAQLQPEGIDVCLFDSSEIEGKEPFYFHASRSGKGSPKAKTSDQRSSGKQMHYRSRLEVAGHSWSIECNSIPCFITVRQTCWPWATLAAGMAFTAILAAYVMASRDRRTSAERLVQEKRLYARGLEKKVQQRTEDLRIAQEEILYRLVSASLWRDQETGMHIRRTGLFSEILAKAAGWSAAEAEMLRLAASMHDVGKIGIPDLVLRKPGKLTAAEFEVIKTHTLIGAEMLANSKVPMLQMAREIALFHHEYWNGEGYPAGVAGLQIPESARILAIVDVYDALTHDRVYRRALPEEEAAAIMVQESGTHFDPSLMALFMTILPEISCISQQHPDEISNNMKLAHSFASVLARSNGGGTEVSVTADASYS